MVNLYWDLGDNFTLQLYFPVSASKDHVSADADEDIGRNQGETYVVCLDCGKQVAYDWENIRLEKPVDVSSRSQGL